MQKSSSVRESTGQSGKYREKRCRTFLTYSAFAVYGNNYKTGGKNCQEESGDGRRVWETAGFFTGGKAVFRKFFLDNRPSSRYNRNQEQWRSLSGDGLRPAGLKVDAFLFPGRQTQPAVSGALQRAGCRTIKTEKRGGGLGIGLGNRIDGVCARCGNGRGGRDKRGITDSCTGCGGRTGRRLLFSGAFRAYFPRKNRSVPGK